MKKKFPCRLFAAGAAMIFSAAAVFPAFAADSPKLSGCLESVTESGITGYAWNQADPSEKVTVELTVYGNSGPGDYTTFTTEASLPRSSSSAESGLIMEPGSENSAFSCAVNWSELQGEAFTVIATAVSGRVRTPLSQSLEYKKDGTGVSAAETTPAALAAEVGELLDTFTASGYCGCEKCSGGFSLTYSGTVPKANHTIAADLSRYPIGTRLCIDGVIYTVEDMGTGIEANRLDIYFDTHEEALAFGLKNVEVYSVK